ncbi:MAG: extracellular solute-binding protein [Bifidobacteriaceae bacterium]|jgi:multiple sugar transport system substrate-binding protein/raffinose/stachyose/melibiose transport system substrate-binding protein|nr:extracellular solute-binding protein [Bifidobacteriaceae bacterium]
MSIVKKTRCLALLAAGALAMGGLAACGGDDKGGGGDSTGDAGSGEQVEIVWWHNVTTDPGKSIFQASADRFMEANPNVKITIVPIQNEDLQDKLQTALNGKDAPDMFQQWGAGEMQEQVDAGYVMDITAETTAEVEAIGGMVAPYIYNDKVYGLPYTGGAAGIYYSQDLFDQAGITETPKTWAEFVEVIEKLKAAGIVPIGMGGKDAWPVGHWLYAFIIRYCGIDVIDSDTANKEFTDSCYLDAAQAMIDLAALEPFEDGWLSVSAQQGAGSSSGLLANGLVAMEYSGVWETGQVQSLTPDGEPKADLRWFAFPQIEGGKGEPGDALGGSDGMSCHANAPKECVEFLKYFVGDETQKEFAEQVSIPSNPTAVQYLATESLKEAATGTGETTYLQIWLDKAFGDSVGEATNTGAVSLLDGQMTPEQFVESLKTAARKG